MGYGLWAMGYGYKAQKQAMGTKSGDRLWAMGYGYKAQKQAMGRWF
jgi:hypothetical protein